MMSTRSSSPSADSPRLPRDEWPQHPNFPAHALLLGSHTAFRRRSEWILERLEALEPGDPRQDRRRRRWVSRMSGDFEVWMAGMRGHERYEESKLYPFLARRFGASFEHLERDHRGLGERKEAARSAFRDAMTDGADRDSNAAHSRLLAALREHRADLDRHLRAEEDLVIPLLLALSRDEFLHYYETPARELLASSFESSST